MYDFIGWCFFAAFAGLFVLGVCGWILDCEDEDRRLGRKPRSSFWLR